jgi:linoleoyl-CoA desaturase
MEETDFPVPDENNNIESQRAIHQITTTTNFATKSRLFSWFAGGLNFQIEHHLFPTISHVHYKKLSKIVKKTADEFGLPYYNQPTFAHAVYYHGRMLYKL